MEEGFFLRRIGEMEICVVGLGLIGGSYAKALRLLKPRTIVGCDCDEALLKRAEREGIIDRGSSDGREAVANADLVILAIYPKLIPDFLRYCAPGLKQGVLITDTASVKRDLLLQVDELLPSGADFVSGHPMAGREGGGYEASDASIFHGSSYILLPRPQNNPENVEFLRRMALALGCARTVNAPWQAHDRIIARTSALPHVLAACLVAEVKDDDVAGFLGGSFQDATRVAKINAKLWTGLFWENREHILEAIDEFKDELDRFKTALREPEKLEALLIQTTQERERLYR